MTRAAWFGLTDLCTQLVAVRAVLRDGDDLASSQNRLSLSSEAGTAWEDLTPAEVVSREFADLKGALGSMQRDMVAEVRGWANASPAVGFE